MEELEAAREAERASFAEFVAESAKATKHTLKANAARHKWLLARSETRALEQDYMSWPVQLADASDAL